MPLHLVDYPLHSLRRWWSHLILKELGRGDCHSIGHTLGGYLVQQFLVCVSGGRGLGETEVDHWALRLALGFQAWDTVSCREGEGGMEGGRVRQKWKEKSGKEEKTHSFNNSLIFSALLRSLAKIPGDLSIMVRASMAATDIMGGMDAEKQ